MNLLIELLALLEDVPPKKNAMGDYTSQDKTVEIHVDADDEEAIEASIWYKTGDKEQIDKIRDAHEAWIRQVFSLYDLNLEDAVPDNEEAPEESNGGYTVYLKFGS